jgi:hypothetical protein
VAAVQLLLARQLCWALWPEEKQPPVALPLAGDAADGRHGRPGTVRRVAALEGTPLATARADGRLFGLWVLYFWQLLVVAFQVPRVLLPAPALIVCSRCRQPRTGCGATSADRAQGGADRLGTGLGLGFGVAVAIDRLPFLQRGLLPWHR